MDLYQEMNKLQPTEWFGLDLPARPQEDKIIYILAGPDTLIEYLENNVNIPAIAVLITAREFNDALKNHSAANVSAIFSDPAPESQLTIAKQLLPQPGAKFAILVDKPSKYRSLLEFAEHIHLNIELIPIGDSVIKTLGRLSEYHGLIALYDTGIYDSDIKRIAIRSTVRRNMALIGFSRRMVIGGALASPYTPLASIAAQVNDFIKHYASHSKLPEARHPYHYSIDINDTTARTIGVKITSDIARSYQ